MGTKKETPKDKSTVKTKDLAPKSSKDVKGGASGHKGWIELDS